MAFVVQVALIGLGTALLAASLLPTLLGDWWIGNLVANFRLQLALAGGLIVLAGLLARSPAVAALGGGVIALNAIAIIAASSLLARPADPARAADGGPSLRVMTLNVLYSNRDLDAFMRCIGEVRPDLLLIQEAGRFWTGALDVVEELLPYRLDLRHTGTSDLDHGVMLFSRHPILEAQQHPLAGQPDRLGVALIDVAGHPVWAASVHVAKPTSQARLRRQRQQLQDLAAWVGALDGPLVLGGDFNATLYMPPLQRFVGTTAVDLDHEARPWRGLLASTFPAALPVLGLKIDHVMVRDLVLRRAWTRACAGSDHRAVAVDLDLQGVAPAAVGHAGAGGLAGAARTREMAGPRRERPTLVPPAGRG